MKVSNILDKIPESGYKSRLLSYPVVMLLALFIIGVQFLLTPVGYEWFDTTSYLSAADHITNGKIDVFRTPIYPAIIAVARTLSCFEKWQVLLVLVQIIAFIGSAVLLQRTASILISNKKIVFWITAFYILWEGNFKYAFYIMTESLSATILICIIWLLFKDKSLLIRKTHSSIAAVLCLSLVLLRPFYVFLFPLIFIYLIVIAWKNKQAVRKNALFGLFVFMGAAAIVGGYANMVKKQYGIQGLSIVTPINNYQVLRDTGIENYPSSNQKIDSLTCIFAELNPQPTIQEKFGEAWLLIEASSYGEFEDYVNASLKSNPVECIKSVMYRAAFEAVSEPIIPLSNEYPWYVIGRLISPNIGALLLLLIFTLCLCVIQTYRHKQLPLKTIMLILILLSTLGVAVLGAQGEWNRLIFPSTPVVLLILGITANKLSVNRIRME